MRVMFTYLCRRRSQGHREGNERRLQRIVARVFRGHLYGRKPARYLRAVRDARSWGPTQWEVRDERVVMAGCWSPLAENWLSYRRENVGNVVQYLLPPWET